MFNDLFVQLDHRAKSLRQRSPGHQTDGGSQRTQQCSEKPPRAKGAGRLGVWTIPRSARNGSTMDYSSDSKQVTKTRMSCYANRSEPTWVNIT